MLFYVTSRTHLFFWVFLFFAFSYPRFVSTAAKAEECGKTPEALVFIVRSLFRPFPIKRQLFNFDFALYGDSLSFAPPKFRLERNFALAPKGWGTRMCRTKESKQIKGGPCASRNPALLGSGRSLVQCVHALDSLNFRPWKLPCLSPCDARRDARGIGPHVELLFHVIPDLIRDPCIQ